MTTIDETRLAQLVHEFKRTYDTSEDLQEHHAEHQRRIARARRMLTPERIPSLSEAEWRELLGDTDALGFWSDRNAQLTKRFQDGGLERIAEAVRILIQRAETALTPAGLKRAQDVRGLGVLIISELLCYRFPDRYWLYSPNVTLPALQVLGDDVKARQPRGKKAEYHLYFAVQAPLDQVRQALHDAGFSSVDYAFVDLFLWWVKKNYLAGMESRSSTDTSAPPKNIWLFQANPRYYNLVAELDESRAGDETIWAVSRYHGEMKPGDVVILWQSGSRAGIYAVGELLDVQNRDRSVNTADLESKPYLKAQWQARLRYTHILDQPILRKDLLADPVLGQMQVIRQPQGTNFRVLPAEWGILESMITGRAAPTTDLGKTRKNITAKAIRDHFAAHGLSFTPHQIATFATALQTKGFVILSGISGTGKTRLAQYFADLMRATGDSNHLFVSVRPDWRDSKSLLGYYNPLTETFDSTPFLRFLLRARTHYDEQGRDALPHFVILDEMNLARVEYYFADFLSVLESGRGDDGYSRETVALHSFQQAVEDAEGRPIPPSLPLSPNLYIVGTVNVDETTHAFSPKVLDRAFTLEFTEVDLAGYPLPPGDAAPLSEETRRALAEAFTRQGRFAVVDKRRVAEFVRAHPVYRKHLVTLNEQLWPHDLHLAYRVFDEIIAFLDNAEAAPWADGFAGLDDAFDTAVLMKVLPKFHGSRGRLLAPLQAVLAWAKQPEEPDTAWAEEQTETVGKCLDLRQALDAQIAKGGDSVAYPRTARKAARMLRQLHDTGFAAFG